MVTAQLKSLSWVANILTSTIVSTIVSAIKRTKFHLSTAITSTISILVHNSYSAACLLCASAGQAADENNIDK